MTMQQTPLFQMNPYELTEADCAHYTHRVSHPWLETQSLQPPIAHIALAFGLPHTHTIVHWLGEQPQLEITSAMLFLGGRSDVIFTRVILIEQLQELIRRLLALPEELFTRTTTDVLYEFSQTPRQDYRYVSQGLLVAKTESLTNATNGLCFWDGQRFYPKPVQSLNTLLNALAIDDQTGDYVMVKRRYRDVFHDSIQSLNTYNAEVWEQRINPEFLCHRPWWLIAETLGYFVESRQQSLSIAPSA